MCQSRNNYEQYTDSDNRRIAEARESLFGIKNARNIQDADSPEEYKVGAEFGKQHYAEHAQYRDDGNPGIEVKPQKHDIFHNCLLLFLCKSNHFIYMLVLFSFLIRY